MPFDAPVFSKSGGFEPPPGVCQSCNEKSDWRMIKVHQQGDQWRAAYAHNVLAGWESGKQPDWSKISTKRGLRFEGWLEFCHSCEPQPHIPAPSALDPKEVENHKGASIGSIRKMLATFETKELPYDKNKRGGEV